MWIVYMYSAGLPLVYFIMAFSLILTYVIDKCLVIKYYKKSDNITDKAFFTYINLMKFSIFLHILLGSFMFTNDKLFEGVQNTQLTDILRSQNAKTLSLNLKPHTVFFIVC